MGYDKIKMDDGFGISSKRDTIRERAYIKSKPETNTVVVNLLPNLPESNSLEAGSFFDKPWLDETLLVSNWYPLLDTNLDRRDPKRSIPTHH